MRIKTKRTGRQMVAMATAGLTALSLSACGSNATRSASKPSRTTTNQTSPTRLTTLSMPNDKPTWSTWFNEIGKDVAKVDGGVGFKSNPYASTAAYQAVADNLVTTSKSPALYTWWSGDQLKLLVNEHAAANLTPEVKRWIKVDGLNASLMSAYEDHGSYYGVPMYTAYWPVFYNVAVFKRYGLQPPKTWPQLVHVVDTLKAHGVTPFGQLVGGWPGFIWFENILINMYPNIYTQLVAGKVSYTNPDVVKAMKFWASLQKDGWFKQYSGTAPDSGINRAFAKGNVAMMLIGSWNEGTMEQRGIKPGSGFNAFVMPPITAGLSYHMIFETGPFVVSNKSPYKAEAIKAVDAFMEPSIQAKWVKLTSFISPESGVPQANVVNDSLIKTVNKEHVDLLNRFWEATPPQIAVAASNELDKEMVYPSQYMSILSDIQTQIAEPYWKANR